MTTSSPLPRREFTLADLERADRSRRTWEEYPWGLSGESGVQGVRDHVVLLHPDLTPAQRGRQLAVVSTWIPTAEVALVAALLMGAFLAGLVFGGVVFAIVGFLALGLLAAVPARAVTAWMARVFDGVAPRSERIQLGGAVHVGSVDVDGDRLHRTLVGLALEQRRWIAGVDPDRESRLLREVWAAAQRAPRGDVVSLTQHLINLAGGEATAAEECPAPQTCCRHRPPTGGRSW